MKKLGAAVAAMSIATIPASAAMRFQAPTGEGGERNPQAAAGKQPLRQVDESPHPGNTQGQIVTLRSGRKVSGKPPSLVRGFTNRHYPRDVQRRWPRGGAVLVRFVVQPNGRADECIVVGSFGDPEAERWTCRLVVQRGRFRPAVDESGEPVAAWYGYIQRDRERFDPSLLRRPAEPSRSSPPG